jgi:hypothetical protein
MWPLFLLRAKGKRKEMTGTQHVGTLKHQFLQYITIKNVFVLFHHQNKFEINYASAIWWRHLPAACNNFFEAGVSGNRSCGLQAMKYCANSPLARIGAQVPAWLAA